MDWIQIMAERRILEGQREGVFDNLPGRGRALPPDPFACLPPELRMVARVLANSGYAPVEVGLRRELGDARARLESATAMEKARMLREYAEAELRYNLAMDRHRRHFG
jgi:hypothetical protein